MSRFLWTQKQDGGPSARFGHAMAYDQERARLVLFGGRSSASQLLSDTWEWDGEYWTQVEDIGPSARAEHAMVYDGERRRTVLFGGTDNRSGLGDTWEWSGEAWTQVADDGPLARSGHAMAFDSERKKTLLLGGASANAEMHGDTWQWDGEEWTQQEDTGPAARKSHAMAYDGRRRRIVLFGGQSRSAPLGDTWEWDGAVWTQMADFGPDPCLAAAMASNDAGAVVYGGVSSIAPRPTPVVFASTWEWNGKHWTRRQDIGPGPRWMHALAFDDKRRRLVLFGGLSGFAAEPRTADVKSDTWESSDSGSGTTSANVTLEGFTLSPANLNRPRIVTALIALSGPAPAGGATVTLASALPLRNLPESIVIPPNDTVGQIQWYVAGSDVDAALASHPYEGPYAGQDLTSTNEIRATLGSVTKRATLTVSPG